MHNIYYLGLSGERSLPFGLLVLVLCRYVTDVLMKCMKMFNAEIIFLTNLQHF